MRDQEVYTFVKGEHDDFSPESQPKGSYRKAVNFVRDESGQLISEKGTLSLVSYPAGLLESGVFNLNGTLIVCLVDSTSTISEIGIIENDIYIPKVSNRAGSGASLQLSSNKLSFLLSKPVDIEARYNYTGDIIVYIVDGVNSNKRINLTNLPNDSGFEEEVQLQFSYKVSRTNLISITNDGELGTGTYILGARYLTSGGNATSIGILTSPIKIVDESTSSTQLDGAPPQTPSSKAINVTIENLDSNYPFIEIVGITYIGIANIPKYSIIGRIEIGNNSSVSFKYYSDSQIVGSLIDEDFTVQPVVYKSANHIQQKDNMLLLSGLKSESVDIDFQSIANQCQLFYEIEEIPFDESMVATVDGVQWVPTGIETATPAFDINTSNVEVRLSQVAGQGYKNELTASLTVGYTREEVYSFGLVPILSGGSEEFAYHIPGFNTSDTLANTTSKRLGTYISSEIYPSGKGYPTGNVRHHRMPSASQERIVRTVSTTVLIRILKIKIILPFINATILDQLQGFKIVRQKRDISNNKRVVMQGIGKNLFKTGTFLTPVPSSGHMATLGLLLNESGDLGPPIEPSPFVLYSPDHIHGMVTNFSFTHAGRIYKYIGSRVYDSRRKLQDQSVFNLLNFNGSISFDSTNLCILHQSYLEVPEFDNTSYTNQVASVNKGFVLPFTGTTTSSYVLTASNGHLVFGVNSGTNPCNFVKEELYFDDGVNDAYQVTDEIPRLSIINIYNLTQNQYGKVEDADYIECGNILFSIDGTTQKIFTGGDTYITKNAIVLGDNPGVNDDSIPIVKSIVYCFLETIGNYSFKHYETNTEEDTTSLPYFPKYNILSSPDTPLGLFNYTLSLGHSAGYNKQYSKEKDIKSFISQPIFFNEVTEFLNRTIRSEVSFEGETADNYRIFLPNNFQDVPKDKGIITNTFVWNNRFYIHTERGLFLTYINTKEQIITDVSQIVIGTGGVFSQPPTELFDIEGGYLGTTSKWAGVVTPFGYFFVVNSKGKIMHLIDTVKEISDKGKSVFFENNIEILQDSPLENIGFIGGFDYLNRRYLITRLGDINFTYSFYLQLDSWTGSHTYRPTRYINRDKELLVSDGTKLFIANKGNTGNYLDQEYGQQELHLSLNFPVLSKKFDNLGIGAKVLEGTKLVPFKFFNYIDCYSLDQRSGKYELILSNKINPILEKGQLKMSYKGREYRMSIPLDAVKEEARDSDIFDDNNLDINKKFKGRLLGNYIVVELSTDYALDDIQEMFLSYIRLIYRPQEI